MRYAFNLGVSAAPFILTVVPLVVTGLPQSLHGQEPAAPLWCSIDYGEWLREHSELSALGLKHEDSVALRPERLSSPSLRYPPELRSGGWQGLVHVVAVLDTTGQAVHVEAVQVKAQRVMEQEREYDPTAAVGSPAEAGWHFARAAEQSLRMTQFRPASDGNEAVAVAICVPVQFTLVGGG